MDKIFIIEHLEPKLWKWCLFEYEHISEIVSKKNLWFTNVKSRRERAILRKFGKVFKKNVKELNLRKLCILEQDARQELTSKDASKFKYFIFGGILGDFPRKRRTSRELTRFIKNVSTRNLGKKQFPTDNAVYVVREILKGKKLKNIKFANIFKLKINEIETIELPFRYVLVNEKPLISEKVVNYLKRKRKF